MAFNCDPTRPYQRCSRCIMDTTDPEIIFDAEGVCNHCHSFDKAAAARWFPNDVGKRKLEQIIERIKRDGRGRDYDCIMGLSGGVDSSYLAYKAREWGLRILAVHVDTGWNSELATRNIELIVKACDLDLYTQVLNWEEVRDLQLAFLKSSVANLDIPQDHAYFANLYDLAFKHKIKYVLTGNNLATEGILPRAWGYDAMDSVHIKDIHRRFGTIKLKHYRTISWYRYFIGISFLKMLEKVAPLNFMPYDKTKAKQELIDTLGWKDYGVKHGESRFTNFFQKYYLPKKFGYDKRIAHLSSIVVSGFMSRDDALAEAAKELYPEETLRIDKEFFLKKLRLNEDEFEALMTAPQKTYQDYRSAEKVINQMRKVKHLIWGMK